MKVLYLIAERDIHAMDIKDILVMELGIREFTGPSLKEAVEERYNGLSDGGKRRVNRLIAREAIKALRAGSDPWKRREDGKKEELSGAGVLAVNHVGPLDITIEWKTGPGGILGEAACHSHPGGDQANVAKVFSAFGEKIALVAVTGKKDGEMTAEWEREFLNERIIPSLIRAYEEDQPVAVYNIVDGSPLPAMFEWAGELSSETVDEINRGSLSMLEAMFKGGRENVWMVLSAGGPLKYNSRLAYYSSLVEKVKNKYGDRVELLIDFKHVSGRDEAMSVLEIDRQVPQDIIKPNLEEFIQILAWSGLAAEGSLDEREVSEDVLRKYALELRKKYNLLGVLVSMGKDGSMLALVDRIIRDKGVDIKPVCHTAAGDSLKAGFVYALSKGKPFEEALHTGNLFGAATASMPGTLTVTPEKFAEVEALARALKVEPRVEFIGS